MMERFNEFSRQIKDRKSYDQKRLHDLINSNKCSLHKYTAGIDFQQIKQHNRKTFFDLLVDEPIFRVLSSKKVVNFNDRLTKVYPLKTIGDGNCLCHAVLLYLIGFQDTDHLLRNNLKQYLNGNEAERLKERFMIHYKYLDEVSHIQSSEEDLKKEWDEAQKMERKLGSDNSNHSVYKDIYLQDIHVFALSNLLKRPIIVLSLPIIKDFMPSSIRGIYLPLLCKSEDCIREPILIVFHEFHFTPLVYVYNSDDDKEDSESTGLVGDVFNNDQVFEIKENIMDKKRTHNFMPLVYSDMQSMALHFLKKDEEKKAAELLDSYLITGFVKMQNINDSEPMHVLAAKCSTHERYEKNCIQLYIESVNNTLKNSH